MRSGSDLLIGVSVIVWLLSLGILFGGVVLVCIRSARRIGLYLLAGSLAVWVLSMGMCVAGMPHIDPITEKHDQRWPAVAPRPASAPSAGASVERERPPIGNWRGGDATMDGTPAVTYRLDSPDKIDGWLEGGKTPTLVVRCHQGRTEVYVFTDLSQSLESDEGGHRAQLRYDNLPAHDERWSESTDDEALFAPDGIVTAKRLGSARTLRFEFTPFFGDPQAATFDLNGVDGVIAHVAKACGWTP